MESPLPLTKMLKFNLPFRVLAILACTVIASVARESATVAPEQPAKDKAVGYDNKIKVSPLLISSTTADGAPIVYPKTDNPEVRILMIDIPPGTETGWHKHPMPCYGYIVSGSITVELENGTKNKFEAGQALAEVVNTLHNGKNTGTETTRILMVVTGAKDVPSAVAIPKP